MNEQIVKSTGCCEPFSLELWQEKEIIWNDKIFVKDHVVSFFHIPLGMGNKIVKNMHLIEKADAKMHNQIMITDEKSLWGADLYIDVTKDVPGAQMTKLTGIFLTKVFEGSYQNVPKWIKEMEEYVKNKNKEIKNIYFYYTTCPKCAKVYGKNYIVLLAQIN
ncbi:MAG: hypothetical protein PHZ07_02975 [Patescibacteria group bacterium]|nr:hypothetical protein [Patescibacteria group bacterium]MDD4304292.1 hypothetical protein [Patescibacteria group bacterium]MDD4695681.1 hypothetical protein [Patescibacteria group bacterium]